MMDVMLELSVFIANTGFASHYPRRRRTAARMWRSLCMRVCMCVGVYISTLY